MTKFLMHLLLAPVLALCFAGQAAEPGPPPPVSTAERRTGDDAPVVTHHSIVVHGERIAYSATAGHLALSDDSGKLQARIFFVAYAREDGGTGPSRPITFGFNGGPGASSMWLHLGVGPKRVVLPADGTELPRSTQLVDNESTWLPFTDLVFVDPVGSGYSRAAEGVDPHQFYDVVPDIDVAAAFVRRYLTRYQRWLSPKLIAGESYGTTRAAGLVNRLQERGGINVNGVVLVSSVLDFQTIDFDAPNDLAYVLAVPSYAAAAWYHQKQAGPVADRVQAAQHWAMTDYLVAMAKGATLADAERERIADDLARYTGLERGELLREHLRVAPSTFGEQLLRAQRRIVGRFDTRVTAALPEREHSESDPSFFLVTGPLVEALNDYLRRDLQYQSELRYEYLSREANRSWKWRTNGQGYLYVSDDLAQAMTRDHRLRVFAAAGYYDLATPYLAQKYVLDHMPLDPALRANVTFAGYASGHQIYTDPLSAARLRADVENFVRCAAEQECG